MTTQKKREEAAQVSLVFHAALTSVGFKTLAESIELWADVSTNPAQLDATSGRWIAYALNHIGIRRGHTRRLAVAYFRLLRALHTGFTVRDPLGGSPERSSEPLGGLRSEFQKAVQDLAPDVLTGTPSPSPARQEESKGDEDSERNPTVPRLDQGKLNDNENIRVESLPDLDQQLRSIEDAAEAQARIVLEALGPKGLEKKLERIGDADPAKQVDQARKKAHTDAGYRVAAASERIALNGGRQLLHAVATADPRVLGFVRVSRTGTPCGWCAMLISRGLIFYSSKSSAEFRADGEKYHDNCHCYAEPVFSYKQYFEDSRFDLNRQYNKLWPKVTEGLSGDDALTAWRRYFRQNEANAQAA